MTTSSPLDFEHDLVLGRGDDGGFQLQPHGDLSAIHGDDEIADLEVDVGGGRARIDPTNHRWLIAEGRSFNPHHVGDTDEEDCCDDVGHGACKENQRPLPSRKQLDLLGSFADDIRLVGAEARNPNIAPERDERDSVVGP